MTTNKYNNCQENRKPSTVIRLPSNRSINCVLCLRASIRSNDDEQFFHLNSHVEGVKVSDVVRRYANRRQLFADKSCQFACCKCVNLALYQQKNCAANQIDRRPLVTIENRDKPMQCASPLPTFDRSMFDVDTIKLTADDNKVARSRIKTTTGTISCGKGGKRAAGNRSVTIPTQSDRQLPVDGGISLVCRICEQLQDSFLALVQHSLNDHRSNDGIYRCAICPESVENIDNFISHVQYHNRKNSETVLRVSFNCILCVDRDKKITNKLYSGINIFYCHLKNDHGLSVDIVENNHGDYSDNNNKNNNGNGNSEHNDNGAHDRCDDEHDRPDDEHDRNDDDGDNCNDDDDKNFETDRRINCPICSKTDLSVYDVTRHIIDRHTATIKVREMPKFYRCPLCDHKYGSLNVFSKHSCPQANRNDCCNITFPSKKCMALHSLAHTTSGAPFYMECDICFRPFDDVTSCYNHIRFSHTSCQPKLDGKPYSYLCICGVRMTRDNRLKRHLRSHLLKSDDNRANEGADAANKGVAVDQLSDGDSSNIGEFKCNYCNMRYRYRLSFTNHLRKVHSEMTVHTCHYCSDQFENYRLLDQHVERRHTPPKDVLMCTGCRNIFNSRSAITQHLLESHIRNETEDEEKLWLCECCGHHYSDGSALKRHVKVHMKRRRQCFTCREVFTSVYRHRMHRRNCLIHHVII